MADGRLQLLRELDDFRQKRGSKLRGVSQNAGSRCLRPRRPMVLVDDVLRPPARPPPRRQDINEQSRLWHYERRGEGQIQLNF